MSNWKPESFNTIFLLHFKQVSEQTEDYKTIDTDYFYGKYEN